MPFPRVSLRSFLSTAKTTLQDAKQTSPPYTIVIGNESADLDSICSAVVLAYLRTYAPKSNMFYVPLSNLPAKDLSLRPELVPALKYAGLKPTDLITLGDLSGLDKRRKDGNANENQFILVDHNSMTCELGKQYAGQVVGCIDHHDEEHRVPLETGEQPRIVRKCGSCCSLVVEYCRSAWDLLAEDGKTEWNSELARLALAPILIDTTNLTQESKVTDADRDAVRYLEGWIHVPQGEYSSEAYFQELTKAKEDIGSLSFHDIMRKDYKEWAENSGAFNLGVSSVVKDINWLIEKAGGEEEFLAAVKEFAEGEMNAFAIMTTSHDGDVFKRELLVWGFTEEGVKTAKKFEESSRDKLGLVSWKDGKMDGEGKGWWRRVWRQGAVENSRKQVAPLLRASVAS